jgi:hypothetical protein
MELIVAAIITGAFGLLTIIVEKGRRENIRDHGSVKGKLDNLLASIADIDEDISHIEDKLDTHIHDHLTGALDNTSTSKKKSQ